MMQAARNLTNPLDGFLRHKQYLLMDRDTKCCEAFREPLEQVGLQCIRLSPRSPDLSAHIERFIRSIKEKCLDRMIIFGERSLRNAAQEFIFHYHSEKNHQELNNRLCSLAPTPGRGTGSKPFAPTDCEVAIKTIEDFWHAIVKLPSDGRKPKWKLRSPGYC